MAFVRIPSREQGPDTDVFYERVKAGWLLVHKFGENPTIATTSDPEDVWDVGGLVTGVLSVTSALPVLVSSSDADDVAADTGARTVTVVGLNHAGAEVEETLTMNGTSAATTTTPLKRVYRMYVASAGTSLGNEGTISAMWSTTTLAAMRPTLGQTQMAFYSVPTGYSKYYLTHWGASLTGANTTAQAQVAFVIYRNGVVRVQDFNTLAVAGTTTHDSELYNWVTLNAGDDVFIRVDEVTATTGVAATFDIVGIP